MTKRVGFLIKYLIQLRYFIKKPHKIRSSEKDENEAIQAVALMQQARVIDVTNSISILAAKLSIKFKIPMADSIIYATAKIYDAVVWTQDSDYKDLEGVKYFKIN